MSILERKCFVFPSQRGTFYSPSLRLSSSLRIAWVNELLSAAFMADLSAALVEARHPQAWSPTANVVIFLDGFEALQRASSTTATRLLQLLTTEPRKQGHTDPLLLVIGSRDPLAGMIKDEQPAPLARTVEDEATAKQRMHDLYVQWHQGLPKAPRALRRPRLHNPALPLRLQPYSHNPTPT